MHWAAHKHTAAEVIYECADAEKDNMRLTSWANDTIHRSDVEVAKNYLTEPELDALNKIVTAYLDIAEVHALNQEPMYMKDWLETINDYLKMTRRDILTSSGHISHKQAIEKAHAEYDKYKNRLDDTLSPVEKDFIESIGMKQHRYMRGYKNVINESIRLNKEGIVSPLAIETSGHGALSENYFLDDGAYMAVKLLIALAKAAKEGKTLASFIEKLEKGYEEREYRFKITGEDFKEYGKQVLAAFEERAKAKGYHIAPNSYEGIRITFDSDEVKGWLLLRMSLHDPQMPLNVEGVREGDCDKLYQIVLELVDGFDRLVIPAK